ncbi:MAG: hypothetical protein KDD29_08850 [Flavobacteriales bacterium]|nr:hypothetical protein [Flavobacteriales bacterium]MCB9335921.1 hypothetical protein [Flavobacteriales bacterium]
MILARGAEMEELTNDLLDHICCMIEERLTRESDYDEVLHETMAVFGKDGIRNIQDETTYLLTKNILVMKKTTHIIGIAAAVLLLVATFLKIYHMPGAGAMYVLGGFLLSFIFLPLMLTIKIKEKISKPRIWLNVAGTISGFILVNGIFFKVMHWPYANVLMTIGMSLALFVFLPIYIYVYIKNKEMRTTTITTAVLVVGAMSMLFALVRLHNSGVVNDSIVNIQYHINDDIVKTMNYNQSLFHQLKNDTLIDEVMLNKSMEQSQQINEMINTMLLHFAEGGNEKMTQEQVKNALVKNYTEIMNGKGDLNAMRTGENTIDKLLAEIHSYETLNQQVLGKEMLLNLNVANLSIYNNPQYNDFPLEIVVSDLTLMNFEIQKQQSVLLLALKK